MAIYKLDILAKEKKENLPYWLDPSQKQDKDHPSKQAIRDKHRARWLAERQAKKEKAWDEGKHPRVPGGSSEGGQFGEGGGGGESSGDEDGGGSLSSTEKDKIATWVGGNEDSKTKYQKLRSDPEFGKILEKLPVHSGTMFRSLALSKADLKKLKVGGTYKIDKYSSASTGKEGALAFGAESLTSTKVDVLLQIDGSGRKIPGGVKHEEEVVLMRGDRYKITEVTPAADEFDHATVKMEKI